MKIYVKRPEQIEAIKLDFSTPEKLYDTLQGLDRCSHILIHMTGDRGYRVILDDDKEGHEYTHGDYICRDLTTYKWYGMKGRRFEEGWNEVD